MQDLSDSVKWLAQHRRWNTQDIVRSIHRDNKVLDGAGTGTSNRFTHLPHRELKNHVYFSLMTDVFTQASGQLWARSRAIPMGGPFNAQSAGVRKRGLIRCDVLAG